MPLNFLILLIDPIWVEEWAPLGFVFAQGASATPASFVLGDAFDLGLKLANIILIAWIFRQNFRERRAERLRDAARDPVKFMVQEVVLKPNIQLLPQKVAEIITRITTLKGKLTSLTDNSEMNALLETEMQELKALVESLRTSIFSPLGYLAEPYKELASKLETPEEIFSEYGSSIIVKKDKDVSLIVDKIEAWRGSLVIALLSAQKQHWENSENPSDSPRNDAEWIFLPNVKWLNLAFRATLSVGAIVTVALVFQHDSISQHFSQTAASLFAPLLCSAVSVALLYRVPKRISA